MSATNLAHCFQNLAIITPENAAPGQGGPWQPHPKFLGVHLKLLVPGSASKGQISCHLVAVDPGCCLETHTHPGHWELHEVMAGSGQADLDGRDIPYAPGTMAIIPQGSVHRVEAREQGLILLAKFFPALV